ncbi:MAG TPA: hypothetical protein DIT35_07555 [Rhodospirillaceae bacterium]|nr:hypothetical protein [Rhodospirillaceae bacterium]
MALVLVLAPLLAWQVTVAVRGRGHRHQTGVSWIIPCKTESGWNVIKVCDKRRQSAPAVAK